MQKLIMENFRCFAGRHEAPLAPLTVLVGENSSGKTSFLAAVRVAHDLVASERHIDFNEEPFRLGSYEQLVTSFGTRAKQPASFLIGFRHCRRNPYPDLADDQFTSAVRPPS